MPATKLTNSKITEQPTGRQEPGANFAELPSNPVLRGEITERPEGYLGPDLNPAGLKLEPVKLGEGVYALMANAVPKDNNGVIIGDKGVLVVDAGINGEISRQIQQIVAKLTHKPILYLVNTTYHGDHTFGNYAFPGDVKIITSRLTRDSMIDFEKEKRIRSGNLRGNLAAIADVQTWRKADIVFDHFVEIDLGNKVVQLWHFGPGNSPGDTLVYVPEAKAVWTGNFLGKTGILPMLLEGGPQPYIETLERAKATLDVETIVPGHGPMDRNGEQAFVWMINYLANLDRNVRAAVAAGKSLEETLTTVSLPDSNQLPEPIRTKIGPLMQNLQRLNVLATYREIEREAAAPEQDHEIGKVHFVSTFRPGLKVFLR